jgi:hypothetical protein
MARGKDNGWVWALGALAIGGLAIAVASAGSEKNSPWVPDVVEKHVDSVVDYLNRNFGKGWISVATAVLQAVLPTGLKPFLGVIRAAEAIGSQQGWSGLQKKAYAVEQYMRSAAP